MKEYVCGFLFYGNSVLLLEKRGVRREDQTWQEGKLNGLGGGIEDGETPLEAMVREFQEESGHVVKGWDHFATLEDARDWRVYFYCGSTSNASLVESRLGPEGLLSLVNPHVLPSRSNCIPNLNWLIPMASARSSHDWPYYIREQCTVQDAMATYGG